MSRILVAAGEEPSVARQTIFMRIFASNGHLWVFKKNFFESYEKLWLYSVFQGLATLPALIYLTHTESSKKKSLLPFLSSFLPNSSLFFFLRPSVMFVR